MTGYQGRKMEKQLKRKAKKYQQSPQENVA